MLIKIDFGHPKGARIGLFTAMQNVGAICALPFCTEGRPLRKACTDIQLAAFISDKFGRRVGVTFGNLVLLVGVIIQVVPGVNEVMFVAGRFIIGLGSVKLRTLVG